MTVSLGNFGTSYAVGKISQTEASMTALNWAGSDKLSSGMFTVYCR